MVAVLGALLAACVPPVIAGRDDRARRPFVPVLASVPIEGLDPATDSVDVAERAGDRTMAAIPGTADLDAGRAAAPVAAAGAEPDPRAKEALAKFVVLLDRLNGGADSLATTFARTGRSSISAARRMYVGLAEAQRAFTLAARRIPYPPTAAGEVRAMLAASQRLEETLRNAARSSSWLQLRRLATQTQSTTIAFRALARVLQIALEQVAVPATG